MSDHKIEERQWAAVISAVGGLKSHEKVLVVEVKGQDVTVEDLLGDIHVVKLDNIRPQ